MDQYWILRPVPEHYDSESWKNSIYRGVALVKAKSAEAARNWATRVFLMPASGEPEPSDIVSPWLEEKVSCEALRSHKFRYADVNMAIGHFLKDMEAILKENGALNERDALRFVSENIEHFPDIWPRFTHKETQGYACGVAGRLRAGFRKKLHRCLRRKKGANIALQSSKTKKKGNLNK